MCSFFGTLFSLLTASFLFAGSFNIYFRNDDFKSDFIICSTFTIKNESKILLGFTFIALILFIVSMVLFRIDDDLLPLVAIPIFLIWFTVTLMIAYVSRAKSSQKYLPTCVTFPTFEEEENYFGNICSYCRSKNETIERRECILQNEKKRLDGFFNFTMIFVGCSITSTVLLTITFLKILSYNSLLSEAITLFLVITITSIIIALPCYTSGLINRKPYKQFLKDNKNLNFGPVIGLSFTSLIALAGSIILLFFKSRGYAFLSFLVYTIFDIALITCGIELVINLKKETIPVINIVSNPLIGLLVPHIVIALGLMTLFVISFWLGGDWYAPVSRTIGQDIVKRYVYRFIYLIEYPLRLMDVDGYEVSIDTYE